VVNSPYWYGGRGRGRGIFALDHFQKGGLLAVEVVIGALDEGDLHAGGHPGGVDLGDGAAQPRELGLVGGLGGHQDSVGADAVGGDEGAFDDHVGVGP
jgi:hypothetical protein